MTVRGIVRGRTIFLDQPVPYVDGLEVDVALSPVVKPPKGSPAALLQVAGLLSDEDAAFIEREIEDAFERIEPEFWAERPR